MIRTDHRDLTVGVLSFQGDFERHAALLQTEGVPVRFVRTPEDLEDVEGLIIPGGESTTIGKLMRRFGLLEATRRRAEEGMPVMGTCAGAILLADEIIGAEQERLGLMDIAVERNAYGRQIESFEADLDARDLQCARDWADIGPAGSVRGVFIRAPIIRRIGSRCRVLATFENNPVVVVENNVLAATFHPELVGEPRVHRCFLSMLRTRRTTEGVR